MHAAPRWRGTRERATLGDCVVDCLEGWIEPAALRTALGDRRFDGWGSELIFLASNGDAPLFQFEVRRDDARVVLQPNGRFGADSLGRSEIENCPELGFDYAFFVCGSGVVKLVIRPHATPFDAEVRAVVTPRTNPFDRSGAGVAPETTPFVSLHVV